MAFNRRLIFWLFKAYLKKWRKTILICFILGLVFFFLLNFFLSTLVAKFPLIQKETIGMVGAYTTDSLPPFVLHDVSRGLTKLDSAGKPVADVASRWDIKDDGKLYIFHLKPHENFNDGSELTSNDIKISFSDVKINRPDRYTISYQLKEPFAPFLVTMARPILKDNYVGLGAYKIKDIQLNGSFIVSLTMVNATQPFKVRVYEFFPTQEALRLAFVLGNISEATGLTDISFKNSSFTAFPNATIKKETDYHQLVTLFYNTQDKDLSNSRLRDAFSYVFPNNFSQGEKAYSAYPPSFWTYQPSVLKTQDFDHAKLLMQAALGSNSQLPTFTIDVLPKYADVAKVVANSLKKIGVSTKIEVASNRPDNFQMFIGDFHVPEDPDQYSLWHKGQENNITRFDNQRIDKLLEDGRKTIDTNARLKIYADFQKYLQDEQPASFLYFPYTYAVTRK